MSNTATWGIPGRNFMHAFMPWIFGGLWRGASDENFSTCASTFILMSVGSLNFSPPCTTLCPTAFIWETFFREPPCLPVSFSNIILIAAAWFAGDDALLKPIRPITPLSRGEPFRSNTLYFIDEDPEFMTKVTIP